LYFILPVSGTARTGHIMAEKTAARARSAAARAGAPAKVSAPAAEEQPKRCGFPGCPNAHHARGYCKKCYSTLRRVGASAFEKLAAEARGKSGPPGKPLKMTKIERLELIKKRHDIRQKEIEAIRQSLETED
jgi:hypothetical protein